MGLFSKKKKQKVPKKVDIPMPTDSNAPDIPKKPPEIPPFREEPVSDNDIKEAIKVDLPPKTEFNAQQVNEDIKYLDEILKNDLDLNSNEISNAMASQPVNPEIQKKLDDHNEVININVGDEEIKPIEEIKPVFSRDSPVKPTKKQETPKEVKDVELLPNFDTFCFFFLENNPMSHLFPIILYYMI